MADNAKTQAKTQAKAVEVYVATHKKIDFALPDYCSRIQVNAERNGQWEGYLHDNDNADDNISLKNPNYCELTALYSMWKNCKADIQGLFHYRRYISGIKASERNEFNILISEQEVKKACISQESIIDVLKQYDVILLNPDTPYITSDTPIIVSEVFRGPCYWKDIRELYNVISDCYPDYLEAFCSVMNSDHYSRCNMFIASRDFVDSYCTWLFDVLGKVEQRISLEGYNAQRARVFGFLSEFLLNVYVLKLKLKCTYYCRLRTVEENICRVRFKRMLRNIPGVLKIVRLIRKSLSTKTSYETLEFFIVTEDIYNTQYMSATVTPKDKNFSLESLGEIFRKLEAQYAEKGLTLLPRIILSPETPDSVKEALNEAGIRIMNE